MPAARRAATTWAELTHVNLEKAWPVLQGTDREGLLVLLARALKAVPPNELGAIFADFARPHEVGDIEPKEPKRLVDAVREFTEAALRSEYYEDFLVNSRNCMDKSGKTEEFGAVLDLLFDRCVDEAVTGDPGEVCRAYELLFSLLREIDKWERDDIVFFADEAGTWQFCTNWLRVLPGYFRCLAKTTEREEFERRVDAVIEEFAGTDGAALRKVARKVMGAG